jgi:hypothetical protein
MSRLIKFLLADLVFLALLFVMFTTHHIVPKSETKVSIGVKETNVLATATPRPPPTPRPLPTARPAPPVRPAIPPRPSPTAPPLNASPPTGSVPDLIRSVFGRYADSALRVARCESGFNPGAYNPIEGATGVFQFLLGTWLGTPYHNYTRTNAWANVNAAFWVFKKDGYTWREWQCQP